MRNLVPEIIEGWSQRPELVRAGMWVALAGAVFPLYGLVVVTSRFGLGWRTLGVVLCLALQLGLAWCQWEAWKRGAVGKN